MLCVVVPVKLFDKKTIPPFLHGGRRCQGEERKEAEKCSSCGAVVSSAVCVSQGANGKRKRQQKNPGSESWEGHLSSPCWFWGNCLQDNVLYKIEVVPQWKAGFEIEWTFLESERTSSCRAVKTMAFFGRGPLPSMPCSHSAGKGRTYCVTIAFE